jgi:hypothetical protein
MPGLAPGFSFVLSIFEPAKAIFKFGVRIFSSPCRVTSNSLNEKRKESQNLA